MRTYLEMAPPRFPSRALACLTPPAVRRPRPSSARRRIVYNACVHIYTSVCADSQFEARLRAMRVEWHLIWEPSGDESDDAELGRCGSW
jgi:hypothetical protein